jgi:methionyl-tRNA formyltransferase
MVGFFLMTEKGLRVLQSVVDTFGPGEIAYVVGASDKDVAKDYRDEIAAVCRQNGIAYFDRTDNEDVFHATAEYHFAVSWRWLIQDAKQLIVLHDSLLPRYRGFAPLPTALINGDPFVGVTALFASQEYDRGDVLGQRKLPVSYPVKIQSVISSLSAEYATLVVELFGRIREGAALAGIPQNEAEATYSLWRDEEDYRIRWSADADWIKRFIDSVGSPYKGASAFIEGRKVRLLGATIEPDIHVEVRQPGKVVFLRQGYPTVVCGRGLLRVTDLRDDATGQALLPWQKLRTRFT